MSTGIPRVPRRQPVAPVKTPVLDGLAQMLGADGRAVGQIGDGSGHLQDSVVGAGREAEGFDRFLEDLCGRVSQPAVPGDLGGLHPGVEEHRGALETALLDSPHPFHAGGHRPGGLPAAVLDEIGIFYFRNMNVQVDAVEQRARDFGQVAGDLARGAAALLHGGSVVAAGTSLRCLFTISLHGPKPKSAYPKQINTLGDHLKKRRLDLGLLQQDVADRIGVDVTTVRNWEGNRCSPKLHYLPRVFGFLGYCPYTVPSSFAEWLRVCRTASGLSQAKLGQELGVDESTVRKWEMGRHLPGRTSLTRVRAFFSRDQQT